jgi:hypothetical protein
MVVLFLLLAAHIADTATEPLKPAASGGKRKLLLFAKNPVTWKIINGGGTGKVLYQESTGSFTLIAANISPRTHYALVRYADAAPKVEVLARGESDGQGRLQLAGVWQNWTRKFWLVPGEDVSGKVGEGGALIAWRPDRYLFEEKPLGIVCACPEPEEP